MFDGICLCVFFKIIYFIVSVVFFNLNFLNIDILKIEKNFNSLYIYVEINVGLSGLVRIIDFVVRVMFFNLYM